MTQFANGTSSHRTSSPDGEAEIPEDINSEMVVPINVVAAGTAVQPLDDFISGGLDIEYYGSVDIGTPKQSLTVQIDTGSADLWVPVNCRSCANKKFISKSSSTYKNTGQKFAVAYVRVHTFSFYRISRRYVLLNGLILFYFPHLFEHRDQGKFLEPLRQIPSRLAD